MITAQGKIKKIIYQNESNGYTVALFKIKECSLKEYNNKSVKLIANLYDMKLENNYEVKGTIEFNDRYDENQIIASSVSLVLPTKEEDIKEFLKSPLIKGCGEKMADKIVDYYKENTLKKIKEGKENLLVIKGMSEKTAEKIYNSLLEYDKASDILLKLKNMGFSINESALILNYFKEKTLDVINNNFYKIKEIIDFSKVDTIYVNNYESDSKERKINCLVETMKVISLRDGHTYYNEEEVLNNLNLLFKIYLSSETLEMMQDDLKEEVMFINDKIYLKSYYDNEKYIAKTLYNISSKEVKNIKLFEDKIKRIENVNNMEYDKEQIKAIKTALGNNFTIISGGPGTGKTTLVKAIVDLYIEENRLSMIETIEKIALLAPTGRASKRLSEATHLPAYTIHKYLKWKKESDSFEYNLDNKTNHKLIIVDEASMIDINLFTSLLKGIREDAKLILVGDSSQLPSVGPGNVLNDLIETDLFNFIPLSKIYRQSDNSFIPYLARQIKNKELDEEYLTKKDDYNFIKCDSKDILKVVKKVINKSLEKNLDENEIQVLAPMYKGENGIDALNKILEQIYNKNGQKTDSIIHNDILYKVGDKVLQLQNNPDFNVFNGDIGHIIEINHFSKTDEIIIDFDSNLVTYHKKDLNNIKHAYAISIHKSQGSEFNYVIMPICKKYNIMLYNKLIYTGVSRAKKGLILIGDAVSFNRAVNNNYSMERKSTLKDFLKEEYNIY